MSAASPVTVVLTLKDRSAFTTRWMRYMNDRRCPYPILIADGGADQGIEAALRDPATYPDVTYTYLRYPFDADDQTYFRKLADVVARVRTPYVWLADNDDFCLLDAVPEIVDFLNMHGEHVSCGGRGLALRLLSHDGIVINGPTARAYHAETDGRRQRAEHHAAIDRMCDVLRHFESERRWMMYYFIHRTPALQSATGAIAVHDFRDAVALEIHILLSLVLAGKVAQIERPTIVRQEGSSQHLAALKAEGNLIERFVRADAFSDLLWSVDQWAPSLPAGARRELLDLLAAWVGRLAARLYPPPPAPPADPVEQCYRWLRRRLRLFRPLIARPPVAGETVPLPELEPYILER